MNDSLYNSLRVIYTVNALRIMRKHMERGSYDLPLESYHIDKMSSMHELVKKFYTAIYMPTPYKVLKIYEYWDNMSYVSRKYFHKIYSKRFSRWVELFLVVCLAERSVSTASVRFYSAFIIFVVCCRSGRVEVMWKKVDPDNFSLGCWKMRWIQNPVKIVSSAIVAKRRSR